MQALVFIIFLAIYILLNLYVTKRINKAYYVQEERRKFHKKFIWFVPLLGPFLIRGFWQAGKNKPIETVTKEERKKEDGAFHESGIAIRSGIH